MVDLIYRRGIQYVTLVKVETRFDKMFNCLCFGREIGNN